MTKISSKDFDSNEPIRIPSTKSEGDSDRFGRSLNVINVRLAENTSDSKVFVFDVLEGDDVSSSRYASKVYSLYPTKYGVGVFDLLNDYFLRRISFFHSSKTCQALMMALVYAERRYDSRNGLDLFEMCAKTVSKSLEKALGDDDVDNPPSKSVLSKGYGIVSESMALNDTTYGECDKKEMKRLADDIVELFLKFSDYAENKHFTAILANTIDDIPTSLCTDPLIDLPMVVYIPEFAHLLMEKICHQFLSSDTFKNAGIESITVDIYLLMPETTLSDVVDMTTKDFELLNPEGMEDEDSILAKYETFDIIESEVDESKFDSIIAYS